VAIQDEIRKAREALKISPAELARRAGIQRSLIGKIERGDNFTIETLQKIVAQLPNLEVLHLGSQKIQLAGPPGELDSILAEHLEAATALAQASLTTQEAARALASASLASAKAIERLAATSERMLKMVAETRRATASVSENE